MAATVERYEKRVVGKSDGRSKSLMFLSVSAAIFYFSESFPAALVVLIFLFFLNSQFNSISDKEFSHFELNAIKQYKKWKDREYCPNRPIRNTQNQTYASQPADKPSQNVRDTLEEIKSCMASMRSLQWREFERVVARAFSMAGYKVYLGAGSNDNGIDITAYHENKKVVIQCKNYKNKISPDPLKSFITSVAINSADVGVFVASNGFSELTLKLAEQYSIQCLDCYDILAMLKPELDKPHIIKYLRRYDEAVRVSKMTEKERFYAKRTYLLNKRASFR